MLAFLKGYPLLAGFRGKPVIGEAACAAGCSACVSVCPSQALALELAKREITVNCVAPGLVDTEMLPAEVVDEAMKMIPLRRVGRPEEVAAAVSYLISDDAAYVTRQVISVNGGML